MSQFVSEVKSTIDKAGVDIARNYPGGAIRFVDLDDTEMVTQLLASNEEAIVWEMLTLEEDPIDPLYSLQFGIGAKSTNDPGRYQMMDLLDAVNSVMSKGSTIPIRDYSPGGDGVTQTGYMVITDVMVDPQLFDKQSGIRLISVSARAVRNG